MFNDFEKKNYGNGIIITRKYTEACRMIFIFFPARSVEIIFSVA